MPGSIIILVILFWAFHGSWYDMWIAHRMILVWVCVEKEKEKTIRLLVLPFLWQLKMEFIFNIQRRYLGLYRLFFFCCLKSFKMYCQCTLYIVTKHSKSLKRKLKRTEWSLWHFREHANRKAVMLWWLNTFTLILVSQILGPSFYTHWTQL